MEKKTFYKYRGAENLRWLLDILINERLYGATYPELNDPMEGYFKYDKNELGIVALQRIRDERSTTRICSLSKRDDNVLMWSQYANGHKGVCIKVEITSKSWKEVPVTYTADIPTLESAESAIETIFGVKLPMWGYEEEVRFVNDTSNNAYLKVKVKEVIFGRKMKKNEMSFLTKIIETINKGRSEKNQIKTSQMILGKLYSGYL